MFVCWYVSTISFLFTKIKKRLTWLAGGCVSSSGVSSCEVPGDLSGRSSGYTLRTGKALPRCVSWNGESAHQNERIATHIPPRSTDTVSLLCGCVGGLLDEKTWCTLSCTLGHHSGESVFSPDQDYSFGCTSVEPTGPTLGTVGQHLATSELVSGLKAGLVQDPGSGLIPHWNSGPGFGSERH